MLIKTVHVHVVDKEFLCIIGTCPKRVMAVDVDIRRVGEWFESDCVL